MIYLSSFKLSDKKVNNPNIYPYNVFRGKYIDPFVFSPITVLYGNNGSGKSTLLNIIANCLKIKGKEYATSNSYGIVDYCGAFSAECLYSLGEDDDGRQLKIPENSRYIKSEDILYDPVRRHGIRLCKKGDVSNRREEVSGFKRRQQAGILHPFCPGKVFWQKRSINWHDYCNASLSSPHIPLLC